MASKSCICGGKKVSNVCNRCAFTKTNNIVICGKPGSGKSTKALEMLGDGILWDLDLIAESLNPQFADYHSRPDDVVSLLLTLRQVIVAKARKTDRPVIIVVSRLNTARAIANTIGAELIDLDNDKTKRAVQPKRTGQQKETVKRHIKGQPKTYGYRWEQFRKFYLTEYPLCNDCEQSGRVTPAAELHHVMKVADHPELQFDPLNIMALCKSCHSKRTAKGE